MVAITTPHRVSIPGYTVPPKIDLRFRLLREGEVTPGAKTLGLYRSHGTLGELCLVFWVEEGAGEFSRTCRVDLATFLAQGEWLAMGIDDAQPRRIRIGYLALTESGTYTFNITEPFDRHTLGGNGLLSGSFPLNMVTQGGNLPSQAEIRILYRPNTGDPGDGILVGTTTCNVDGTWQVSGLNENLKFDIVARIPGFNDVLISDVQPTGAPLSAYFVGFKEEYEYEEEVSIQVVALGGKPPYVFETVSLPEGLSMNSLGVITGNMLSKLDATFDVIVTDSENTVVTLSADSYVPSDPYWDNVVALLHFDGDLTDERGRTWTMVAGTTISTSRPIFGTGSLLCGDLDHGCSTSNPIADPAAKFTIEMFFELSFLDGPLNPYGTKQHALWGQCQSSAGGEQGLVIEGDGTILADFRGGSTNNALVVYSDTILWEVGKRYHIAHSYDGSTHRVFLDGNQIISADFPFGWKNTNGPFYVGRMYIPSYPQYRMGANAKFDELRITKGVARYTENFTPPTASFPNL